VVDWPDPTPPEVGVAVLGEVATLLRRVSALRAELGEPAPPLDLELSEDPVVAGYQATAVAPLGPADRQTLLGSPDAERRAEMLRDMLGGHLEMLQARLAGG
jgi:Lon protease-like protein